MQQAICAVVGAGPGIGLAVARRFARQGMRVALLARRPQALDGYVAEMAQAGLEAQGFPANAGDEAAMRQAFEQVRAQMGDPAVLVYNAAVLHEGKPSTFSAARLVDDFRVNVAGALLAVQQVLPAMRARQQGTILLTGGGLALNPLPQFASLSISKAGLRSLSYSLAAELQGDGLHVATVTVAGYVQAGSHFDPDRIADAYWKLHAQQPDTWQTEVVYR